MTSEFDLSVLLEEYVEDALNHLDAAEEALLRLETACADGCTDLDSLNFLLGGLHTLKGNSGMMGLRAIQGYVHKVESLLKNAAEGSVPLSAALFEMLFRAVDSLRAAVKKTAEGAGGSIDFADEMTALECLVAADAGTTGWAAPAGSSFSRAKSGDVSFGIEKSSTIKVSFSKLDELLNLVGELVIHRTSLLALEEAIRERLQDRHLCDALSEAAQQVAKTAGDLREGIMKARMLPIRTVFHRFAKLVRDLSQVHEKQIRLVFQGEETELDKTVIDEIGEPLLHLIRNAVDHGIETPAERIAAGKIPAGTIRLSARHESNHIIVQVQDNGRGIEPDRVLAKAVSRGLVSQEESQEMTENDVLQLLFVPGFSTSETVTETSGRGIGLDVVKNIVTSFNGFIEVRSTPGEGTVFTIRLPLTLAIISALMVDVGGRTFALPLNAVLESLRESETDIHTIATGSVLRYRERLLPLVRMGSFYGLGGDGGYVVVVANGEKSGAVVVDRLIGQQEIVIKAMDDYLGKLRGISGGTVLGDGAIAMVVDIPSLFAAGAAVGESAQR